MNTSIHWFEIATVDITRAIRFYETVLGTKLLQEESGPRTLAIFPTREPKGTTGCLVNTAERNQPSTQGTLVYLGCGGQLDACLARVQQAGGAVVQPKTDIGPNGVFAIVRDTEGNHVGLHDEAIG